MPTSTVNASRKSITGATTAASGMISRGKKTFVIRFWFPTMLVLLAPRQDEKYVQGRSAVKVKSAYGTWYSDFTCSALLKSTVKTTMVTNGCRIAQEAPRAVCL